MAATTAVALLVTAGCTHPRPKASDVHIGRRSRTTTSTAVIVAAPEPLAERPAPHPPGVPLLDPDGRPWGAPLVFHSDVPIPDDLVFTLVVGSDARPNEDPRRAHGDSIHLLAVDPAGRRGTVLGFPRDSWVEVPGHGNRKLTDALLLGGPDLMARTVEHLTGLPVDLYVVTGFRGLPDIVDELGGVDVYVDRTMNDRYSGARFKPGWHHMNGGQVLAYSRDRHDVESGDFTRSLHQGNVILSALAKMRAEVGDDDGVRRWIDVLLRHAYLDTGMETLRGLGTLARGLDPAALTNAVVPGRVGNGPGGQSVVYLDHRAADMFLDLRPDAVLGSPPPPPTTSTTSSTTTSTTLRPLLP